MLKISIISGWIEGEFGLRPGDGVDKYVLELEWEVGMLIGWLSLYGEGIDSKYSIEDCGGYFREFVIG